MKGDDLFTSMLRAIPAHLREDTFPEILAASAKADPAYWTTPITSAECAAFLGISPGALATMRHRGSGPPGYHRSVHGGMRYPSRLEVLTWARAKSGLDDARVAA